MLWAYAALENISCPHGNFLVSTWVTVCWALVLSSMTSYASNSCLLLWLKHARQLSLCALKQELLFNFSQKSTTNDTTRFKEVLSVEPTESTDWIEAGDINTHDHILAEVIIRQREYCHRSKACLIIRRNTQQTQGRIIEIMQPAQALCTLTRKPFTSVSILKHKIQKIILSFYSLFLHSQIQGLHQTIQFDKGSVWFHCSTGESSCTTGTFNSHQLQVLQTQSSSLKDALSSYPVMEELHGYKTRTGRKLHHVFSTAEQTHCLQEGIWSL